jgi:hypothetical protein
VARRGCYDKAEFPSAEILRFQARNERKILLDKPQQPSRVMCRRHGVWALGKGNSFRRFLPCSVRPQGATACRRRTLWIPLMIV